jgi:hypothetical protein
MVLQTDPNGAAVQNANAFIGRFPFAKLGISAAENSLARSGLDYQRDLKPLHATRSRSARPAPAR